MIDIHTHILPGIDDGSKHMKDSIKMARMAYDSGVDTIVATPHCNIDNMYDNYYSDMLEKLLYRFQEELTKEMLPIKVILGMEIYATEEVPSLLRMGKLTTINQSRYLLLEFGFRYDPLLIDFLLEALKELGIRPIIAHPERYPYVQKKIHIAYSWIERGCLLQVNKGSILGSFGPYAQGIANQLLKDQEVAIVASDAHSPLQRTTDLSKVYEYLKITYGYDYAKMLLYDNPKNVIEDRGIIRQQEKGLQDTNIYAYHRKRG